MYSKISNILNDINTVLVPRLCFGCNALLYRGEEHICTVCRNQLPLTEYTFNALNPVDRIFFGRINIIKASSFLFFTEKGIVKSIIHYLKYKNQEQIGAFLGNWYGHILKENNFLNNIDYVVPVPLHRKKLKKRGYNQVSLFAKSIAEHIGAHYLEGVLIKTANTKTQTKKSRILRWQHKQALYVLTEQEILKNKNVLLLDDVITTGATMEACATALSAAKGINLYVASMAIVP
ncbi:ComF family protein [Arenibacter sp. ARW7G5Y1]|uniref:ComF family protein n=1 Tax=Arenibacter sp. ARW7G5Y1 TaxID=2135619 RepID=UPI000D772FCC|nr:phosphoribosyltransferase family protein [Arenibacter sp. ARW7G5Y1]PXX31487.1 ComF family protein [Arenibacter sp. ARW7G5Y1]